jgi:predicted Zn finger-like uncharacterized protein
MRWQCPDCSTSFTVEDEEVVEDQIRVLCPKCGHLVSVADEPEADFSPLFNTSGEGVTLEAGPDLELGPVEEDLPISAEQSRRGQLSPPLLILALALVAVALVYAYLKFSTPSSSTQTGSVEIVELRSYYTDNRQLGTLLVIEGKAVNKTGTPKGLFKIRGVLQDSQGMALGRTEVYAGNLLSAGELAEFSLEKIAQTLENQQGAARGNLNIPPGGVIPFLAVFSPLPAGLARYSVQVVSGQEVPPP